MMGVHSRVWPLAALVLLLQSLSLLVQAQDAPVFSKQSNDSLLWGPYRPNLYFGIRPRLPKSVITGLSWARVEDFQSVQTNFRHTCEQHEGMAGYGWDSYDPRTGGSQTIHDAGNGIDLTTEFVKFPEHGTNGGSWGARIRGTPRGDVPDKIKTAIVFYVGVEGLGTIEVEGAEDNADLGFDGDVKLSGQTPDLGDFTLNLVDIMGNHPVHNHKSYAEKPLDKTLVHSMQVPEQALWQAKSIMFSSMKTGIDAYIAEYTESNMPPPWQTYTIQNLPGVGNLHMVQKTFEGAFEFDILFSNNAAPQPLTSKDIDSQIKKVAQSFSDKYIESLKPQAPFTSSKYLEFSKSLFSNLIGGVGYFYGDQLVDKSYASEYDEENEGFWRETAEARARAEVQVQGPYELFTSIPSRPFFPRGFLWDEGFHLLPIIEWDVDLTLQIIKSWFNLMDDDGWIAREQILGPEARSKVPQEFQVQYPHYANPPTLFFAINAFLDKISGRDEGTATPQKVLGGKVNSFVENPKLATTFLRDLYPLLKRHYYWLRKTQWGDIKSYDRNPFSSKEAYRWRGSTQRHLLTSGLDDYPRPQPPHPGELHTDLISWMGMLTRTMKQIAIHIKEIEDVNEYAKIEEAILQNIDDLHWDEDEQTYCDATIDDYEESTHVCHKGYISIFPFMVGLLDPQSKRLGAVLDLIQDPNELWSNHGIRSLSMKDEFYGTDENYWRSPVWMNMNYLIVRELYNIATQAGPHSKQASKMYTQLRQNLVTTVYESWKQTGFAWEQYNPETGAGQRTQHFTGWTSLVTKIMAMPDLGGKGHDEL